MIDSGRVASGGPPQASGDRRRNFLLGWVQEPAAAPPRAEVERDRAALRAQIADSQRAFKSTVAVRLGAGWAGRVKWARGPLPVISNLAAIRMAEVFDTTDRAHVLDDVSAPTALEQADGDWELAVFFLGGPSRVGSVSELTARYNQHVWPARARPSTRSKNWRYWSLVVTWAVARKYCAHLVPMSADTLKAITWDLIVHAASRSLILAVWAAVQSRHAMFHLPPPIVGRGEFSAWVRSLSTITGCPSSLKLPIHRSVVAWLLRARPCTVAQHRSRLLTSLATLACLRVREVANLQVCDLWFDYLPGYGILGYEGTCGIHVLYRKNDSYRKGHWPALGRSSDPALDLVVQLRSWLGWLGLSVQDSCEKRRRPAARWYQTASRRRSRRRAPVRGIFPEFRLGRAAFPRRSRLVSAKTSFICKVDMASPRRVGPTCTFATQRGCLRPSRPFSFDFRAKPLVRRMAVAGGDRGAWSRLRLNRPASLRNNIYCA